MIHKDANLPVKLSLNLPSTGSSNEMIDIV